MENNKQTGDLGTMIGIVIVIIILVIGGLYFAKQRVEKNKEFQNTLDQGQVITTSDNISDLEKDAESMNFDNLGSDINGL